MNKVATAKLFGAQDSITLLHGGQGSSFRSGSIVVKPAYSELEANWQAQVFMSLPASDAVRLPKPVISINGNWVESNYVAWTYVAGEHAHGRFSERLAACEAYHEILKRIEKPDFLETRADVWSVADRKAWGEQAIYYEADLAIVYSGLLERRMDLDLSGQVIHGDFYGNVLFAEGTPPAVIDFSPYWRPACFAKAVMLMDAMVWENEVDSDALLVLFNSTQHIEQLALRATLRRIFEQLEHIRTGRTNREEGIAEAIKYRNAYTAHFP